METHVNKVMQWPLLAPASSTSHRHSVISQYFVFVYKNMNTLIKY